MADERYNMVDPLYQISDGDYFDITDKSLAETIGRELDSGSDGDITLSSSNFNSAAATFTSEDIDRFIYIFGATNPGNNGVFRIETFTDANNVILDPDGATFVDESSLDWVLCEGLNLNDRLNYKKKQFEDILGGSLDWYGVIPTYVDPSNTAVAKTANLSNIAGNTLDAKTIVVNVFSEDHILRPSISHADGNIADADETFTTDDSHFISSDLNSYVQISGTAGDNGDYRITAVNAADSVELEGLNSTAGGLAGVSWTLLADQKAIPTALGHADSVDRRGIPIADSGAEDETNYEATYIDIITQEGGGAFNQAGSRVFGRSYADDKSPNSGGAEGTLFVLQLLTGTNDAGASEYAIEAESSGSAASVTSDGTNITITGLSGIQKEDVGKYIQLHGVDTSGYAVLISIDSVVSTSEVTSLSALNLGADANDGAINWEIVSVPYVYKIYFPQRKLRSEMSETDLRVVLTTGSARDAALAFDIENVLEFTGAEQGASSPNVVNSGNFYVFSDLPDPSDTSLEEMLNTINFQIGNRDYTGPVLTDGETITESLQALSDEITSNTISRVVERLTVAIPTGTAHTLPGSNSYVLDGTDNGNNLWVNVGGLRLIPHGGPSAEGDYVETSTTQITFRFGVGASKTIDYYIRG